MARDTAIVQSFKQRLVPFAPSSKASKPATPAAEPVIIKSEGKSQLRPKTPPPHSHAADDNKPSPVLRLYPSKADDEKIATAAFSKMFQEEQKALMAARQELPAAVPKSVGNVNEDTTTSTSSKAAVPQTSVANTDSFSSKVDMVKTMGGKILPAAPTGLRRIKTGQVKTVTVAPPRPPKRANTSDVVGGATAAAVAVPAIKIRTGPLFKFANVGGAKAQEFEIVSGGPDGAGQAF